MSCGAAPGGDAWDDVRVQRWLSQSEALDRQMAPITDALFGAVDLQPGERVLDVGCGHGPTTRRAAVEVGRTGSVEGVDISPAMTEAASSIPTPPLAAEISWSVADVVGWEPTPDSYDVVISRFGVMFFSGPVGAFAALRTGISQEGRLCIATWARRDRSEMFQLPLSVVSSVLEDEGLAVPPLAVDGGAFSLGSPEAVDAVLTPAGWSELETDVIEVSLRLGGGLPPHEAAKGSLDIGPSRVLTSDLDDRVRSRCVDEIAERYQDHLDDDGNVVVGGTILVTVARA